MNWDYKWEKIDKYYYLPGIQNWDMLTRNLVSELPCKVFENSVWFCGLHDGTLCVRMIVDRLTGDVKFDNPYTAGIG